MKKGIIGWLMALSAVSGLGLSSCQSDEPAMPTSERGTFEVSLTAALPDDATRASLTPNGNILKFAWNENDKIYVVNAANNEYLGTLTTTKLFDNNRKCEFKGSIYRPAGENITLRYYYLGKEEMTWDNAYQVNPVKFDFSTQTGTAEELDDYDALIATQTYPNLQGDLGMVDFKREFAFAYFVFKYNGEELNVKGCPITVSNVSDRGALNTKAELDCKDGSYTYTAGTFTVTPASTLTGNSFYMNLLPSSNVKLHFSCTIDGLNFEGETNQTFDLNRDTYYTNAGEPIIIEMNCTNAKKQFTLRYHSNLEPDEILPEPSPELDATATSYTFTVRKSFPAELIGYDNRDFLGWSTNPDATTPDADETIVVDSEDGKDLYAVWGKEKIVYRIHYNSEIPGVTFDDEWSLETTDDSWTGNVDDETEKIADKKPGYIFIGWTDKPGAQQTADDKAKASKTTWTLYRPNPEVTLYPVWEKAPETGIGTDDYRPGTLK